MTSEYFCSSYEEARNLFRTVCENAGGRVETFLHPWEKSPRGEKLSIDVGRFNHATGARALLIATCGTHGLEAAAGSATMLQWIASAKPEKELAPADVEVLFIHGLNPYGWAYGSRTNERNVDLNRNFIDYRSPPSNPGYKHIHSLIDVRAMSNEVLDEIRAGFKHLEKEEGADRFTNYLHCGQYEYPDGILYGGGEPEWSNMLLRKLIRNYARGKTHVAYIDWHTGLGVYGDPFFLPFNKPGTEELRQASQWWGIEAGDDAEGYSGAARPVYQGLVFQAVEQEAAGVGAKMTGAVIEFGTYDNDAVIGAIIADRWLRFNKSEASPEILAFLQQEIKETFCPESEQWRESVLRHSERIYKETLQGLRDWSANG